MRRLTRVKQVYECIEAALAVFAAVLIAAMTLIVTIDVLLRYFFNAPLLGAAEICAYSLVWLTFLAAAWILKKEAHVMVNLVTDRLTPDIQLLSKIAISIVGVVVSLFLVVYGSIVVQDYAQRKIIDIYTLAAPLAPLYAVIPIGCTFLMIRFALRAYGFIEEWKRSRKAKETL